MSLATEIVYGILSADGAALAFKFAPRGLPKDDLRVGRTSLAAYQLLALDRVPAHAAVNATRDP